MLNALYPQTEKTKSDMREGAEVDLNLAHICETARLLCCFNHVAGVGWVQPGQYIQSQNLTCRFIE